MAFLIYGYHKKAIGFFEPLFYECPVCHKENTTYIVTYSTYFHFFWIPAFPVAKESVATCSECSFLRHDGKFGPILIKEFAEHRKKYKHPWWTYTAPALLAAIAIGLIIEIFS